MRWDDDVVSVRDVPGDCGAEPSEDISMIPN